LSFALSAPPSSPAIITPSLYAAFLSAARGVSACFRFSASQVLPAVAYFRQLRSGSSSSHAVAAERWPFQMLFAWRYFAHISLIHA